MRSQLFKFKKNPINIRTIFLLDEINNKYLKVPNADPEFGDISEEEYMFLRRELIKNGFKPDTAAIMRAQENITDLITGSKVEKRNLLRAQRRARSRSKDLENQRPPSHQSEESTVTEDTNNTPYKPTKLEVELPE